MQLRKPPGPGGGQFCSSIMPLGIISSAELDQLFNNIATQTISAVTSAVILSHLKKRKKKKQAKAKEMSVKVHIGKVTRQKILDSKHKHNINN